MNPVAGPVKNFSAPNLHKLLEEDQDLKTFASQFFGQIKACSQIPIVNSVSRGDKFLDHMATLLTGDETCAAIAISGPQLLIATNNTDHEREVISANYEIECLDQHLGLEVNVTRGQARVFEKVFQLKLTLTCSTENGHSFSKSEMIQLRVNGNTQEASLDKNKLSFEFSSAEHKIESLQDLPFALHLTLHDEGDFAYWNAAAEGSFYLQALNQLLSPAVLNAQQVPKNVSGELPKFYVGPLQRRATKVVNSLSLIAKTFFGRTTGIDAEPTEMEKYLKTLPRWEQILRDSLTYELSKCYKKDVWVDLKAIKDEDASEAERLRTNLDALQELYRELIDDFKKAATVFSVQDVTNWMKTVPEKIKEAGWNVPLFILDAPDKFLEALERHFKALVYVEHYVRVNAGEKGELAKILCNENIYEKTIAVKLIDGGNEHAEMKLFNEHLSSQTQRSSYYGIAKLCCLLCHYTFKQFENAGYDVAGRRGSHRGLFGGWEHPPVIVNNLELLKTAIGGDAASTIEKILSRSEICFKDLNKVCHKHSSLEFIKMLVRNLSAFNSKSKRKSMEESLLNFLGFNDDDLIQQPETLFIGYLRT